MTKSRKLMKPVIGLILCLGCLFHLSGCGYAEALISAAELEKNEISEEDEPASDTMPEPSPDETQDELQTESQPEAGYGRKISRDLSEGSDQVVTVMVYLCGSDLESEGGAATRDILEMIEADIGTNMNVVLETGGANHWLTEAMDPEQNQRWQITDEEFLLLESLPARNMSDSRTLQDFITYSAEQFPADRYMLVLWDHGGGPVAGCIYDERFQNEEMMSLVELEQSLAGAAVGFDMLGFDCCLMGSAETAFIAEKYADYMIASQRVMPGSGWYYTGWLSALSADAAMPTADLGKLIVDDYLKESDGGYISDELTLSVIDLSKISGLFDSMYGYFSDASETMVEDGMFISTAYALGIGRAMQSESDLVDLGYLIGNMDEADVLQERLSESVVYNGTNIADHSGLSLYLPYANLSEVKGALDTFAQIGIDERYQSFIADYANLMLGAQVYNETLESGEEEDSIIFNDSVILDALVENDWADQGEWTELEDFFEDNSYDDTALEIVEKGDNYVLSLSDEEWEQITMVEQRVFLDDGEGWIDLGADNVYEFDEDGDLLITFDNTWVSLDGQVVCYYTETENYEDEDWYTDGVVPILYEDENAELVVRWDSENPDGYVAGWRYTDLGSGSQKGLFELEDGMRFDFLCDYYTYDNEFDDQYLWGEMTVDGPVTVSYEDVGEGDCEMYYELYDLFNNSYWTESVLFYSTESESDSGNSLTFY